MYLVRAKDLAAQQPSHHGLRHGTSAHNGHMLALKHIALAVVARKTLVQSWKILARSGLLD